MNGEIDSPQTLGYNGERTRCGGLRSAVELFGFGPHLMFDGFMADPDKLGDGALIAATLVQLCADLKLNSPFEPEVFGHGNGKTGMLQAAGARIVLQTFVAQRYLRLDVFANKDFNAQRASGTVVGSFAVGRSDAHMTNRGREYPRDRAERVLVLTGERDYLLARIG